MSTLGEWMAIKWWDAIGRRLGARKNERHTEHRARVSREAFITAWNLASGDPDRLEHFLREFDSEKEA